MKNFIKWFKNSKGVKRWIVVIFISILLICYGFSKVMSTKELNNVVDLIKIVLSFVIRICCFYYGNYIHTKKNYRSYIENGN